MFFTWLLVFVFLPLRNLGYNLAIVVVSLRLNDVTWVWRERRSWRRNIAVYAVLVTLKRKLVILSLKRAYWQQRLLLVRLSLKQKFK